MKSNISCTLASLVLLLSASCSQDSELAPIPIIEQSNHVVPIEVRKQQAMKVVDYISMKSDPKSRSAGSKTITSISILGHDKNPITKGSENEPAYYVFRFGDHEGFAIMGADNRIPGLLAVGDGDPNPENPEDDLPDVGFWVPPVVNQQDTIGTIITPPLESEDFSPEYATLLSPDPLRTHWGVGMPFNSLVTTQDSLELQYELRAPTEVAAMAQILLSPKSLNKTPAIYLDNDTINLKNLRKYIYKSYFVRDTIGIKQVAKLYNYLQEEHNIYTLYSDYYRFFDDTNKEYIAGMVAEWCSLSETNKRYELESYNAFYRFLRRYGFYISPRLDAQSLMTNDPIDYTISTLNEGGFILTETAERSSITNYTRPVFAVGHNLMYNMYEPEERYLLINRCKDGNGDGYYYIPTFKSTIYVISRHPIWY